MKKQIINIKKTFSRLIFKLLCIFPIKDNRIVFESEKDMSDNAFALFEYMLSNKYSDRYNIIWFVEKPNEYNYENTLFIKKFSKYISFKRLYYLATCKYFIFDHNNLFANLYKRKEQKVIYLSHGCSYKKAKGELANEITIPDETYITSHIYDEAIYEFCGYPINTYMDIGFSRLDYFFKEINSKQKAFIDNFHFNVYKKIVLWMPTFRLSINKGLSEDYANNKSGLPIITDVNELEMFNNYCINNKVLCFIKLHHLQLEQPIFKRNLSNVIFLRDEDIFKYNLQLYEFVRLTDALITDYSSIYNDYLLLDKPIIFTLDDLEEYENGRGLSNENLLSTLKGEKVYTYDNLLKAINNIIVDKDIYKKERNEYKKICHTHIDGNASKRILEHLNIK